MKSFKQHLNEGFASYSTSDYVFTLADHIPISGPMLKRIWPDTIRTTVFHATDLNGLKALKKLEGGKKSISAFFSMMSRYMEKGVATGGGIVVEMDADVLVSAKDDIMSKVDKKGRRWVALDWFANASRTGPKFGIVEKEFSKLKENLVRKYVNRDQIGDWREVWKEMKHYLKGDGKKLSLVIKNYFDGVEKILKKNKEVLGNILYGYAKSKRMTDNAWDEQIVNNIKVKKVHLIQPTQLKIDTADPDRTHPIDSFEIAKENAERLFGTVKVWDVAIDLEIYTRAIVKKEQPPRNIAY